MQRREDWVGWGLCPDKWSPRNSSQTQGHGEGERDKQQFMLTFTPKATLETPVIPNMYCMYVDSGINPLRENPHRHKENMLTNLAQAVRPPLCRP